MRPKRLEPSRATGGLGGCDRNTIGRPQRSQPRSIASGYTPFCRRIGGYDEIETRPDAIEAGGRCSASKQSAGRAFSRVGAEGQELVGNVTGEPGAAGAALASSRPRCSRRSSDGCAAADHDRTDAREAPAQDSSSPAMS